jgi:fructuronate reductase
MSTPARAHLGRATLGRVPPALRGPLEPGALSIGVVHLGLGAFHRAHQLSFLEDAAIATGDLGWGVSSYSERSPAASELLAAQDGLFSLREAAPGRPERIRVIASLREARFAPGDPVLIERLADPAVGLVTLTVTEEGYRHDPATRRLRETDAELLADAAGRPPVSVVGQLVRGLEARHASEAPLTICSCDNLPENGHLLEGLVREFCALPGARVAPGLAEFINEQVRFPCSMVDRIVPAQTSETRAAAAAALGLEDAAALATEPFSVWVLEDNFAGARPALERAGVQIVGDVAPHEELKLRVLNGAHSALAYLGLLAGDEKVETTVARPAAAAFVRALVTEEVVPTLDAPAGVDVAAYCDMALERFANPLLAYRNAQVAGDGSNKLPARLLGTVRRCLSVGIAPRRSILVVAAFLRCVQRGRSEDGRPFTVADPRAVALRPPAGEEATPEQCADNALSHPEVFGADLCGDPLFRRLLLESLSALAAHPTLEVISDGRASPQG